MWAHSSVWIEWLPAEQLVVGSNPSEPVIFKHYGNSGNIEINHRTKLMMNLPITYLYPPVILIVSL